MFPLLFALRSSIFLFSGMERMLSKRIAAFLNSKLEAARRVYRLRAPADLRKAMPDRSRRFLCVFDLIVVCAISWVQLPCLCYPLQGSPLLCVSQHPRGPRIKGEPKGGSRDHRPKLPAALHPSPPQKKHQYGFLKGGESMTFGLRLLGSVPQVLLGRAHCVSSS